MAPAAPDSKAAFNAMPEPPGVDFARDVVIVRARSPKWVWLLPLWLLAGAALGAVAEWQWGLLTELGGRPSLYADAAIAPAIAPLRLDPIDLGLTDTSEALAAAIDFASASTVLISARHADAGSAPAIERRSASDSPAADRLGESLGAGIVYRLSEESIYVLTNQHVVKDAGSVWVTFRGTFVTEAIRIAEDASADVAVLRVPRRDVPFVPARAILADSSNIRPGLLVLALGQPAGFRNTATLGIVSAIERPGAADGESPFVHYLQSSAPINRGNSGGPLVDLRGRVVGLNSWKIREAEGLGFALPANFVRRVADDLIQHGSVHWPYLGIEVRELDPAARAQLGSGVWVSRVRPDSPASEAGLAEDDVVRQIERRRVRSTADVYVALGDRRPGDRIVLVVMRGGRERTIGVTLTASPNPLAGTGDGTLGN